MAFFPFYAVRPNNPLRKFVVNTVRIAVMRPARAAKNSVDVRKPSMSRIKGNLLKKDCGRPERPVATPADVGIVRGGEAGCKGAGRTGGRQQRAHVPSGVWLSAPAGRFFQGIGDHRLCEGVRAPVQLKKSYGTVAVRRPRRTTLQRRYHPSPLPDGRGTAWEAAGTPHQPVENQGGT